MPASCDNSIKHREGTATQNEQRRSILLHPTTDMVHDCCCSPVQSGE